jgi:hypothetical protein
VHDSKRDAWIADLADPAVPLSKLAGNPVPHPFKGHDLLDMLSRHQIPIERAVWYVRVLGAHETVSKCLSHFLFFWRCRVGGMSERAMD